MNITPRTLLRIAGGAGLLAAITYLVIAPIPRRDSLAPGSEWTDYRDASFRRIEARLQRADPVLLARSGVAALQKRDFKRLLAHCSPRIQQRLTPQSFADRFDENAIPSVAEVVAFAEPLPISTNSVVIDVFYQHRDRTVAFRWRLSRDDNSLGAWRITSIGPPPSGDPRPNPDVRNER